MKEKFENVPVDEDTRILAHAELQIGDRDALYQKWSWDGVIAESLIFDSSDVQGLNEQDLRNLAEQSGKIVVSAQFSVKTTDAGYTFVNWSGNGN